jgi:hypothetical protein
MKNKFYNKFSKNYIDNTVWMINIILLILQIIKTKIELIT